MLEWNSKAIAYSRTRNGVTSRIGKKSLISLPWPHINSTRTSSSAYQLVSEHLMWLYHQYHKSLSNTDSENFLVLNGLGINNYLILLISNIGIHLLVLLIFYPQMFHDQEISWCLQISATTSTSHQAQPTISNESENNLPQIYNIQLVTIHIVDLYKATYYESSGVCYTHPRGWLQIFTPSTIFGKSFCSSVLRYL